MMWPVVAIMWMQTADLATVRLCIPGNDGVIQAELGFRRDDGRVWWSPLGGESSAQRQFEPASYSIARGRTWFESRAPLEVSGRTFVYERTHQASWAYNRYYRHHHPIDGVAAAVPLGRENDTLLILEDPIGCWFAEYSSQPPP